MTHNVQILSGQPGVEALGDYRASQLGGLTERWESVKDNFWTGVGWALGASAVAVTVGLVAGQFGRRRRR